MAETAPDMYDLFCQFATGTVMESLVLAMKRGTEEDKARILQEVTAANEKGGDRAVIELAIKYQHEALRAEYASHDMNFANPAPAPD